jgi:hypothetical protein
VSEDQTLQPGTQPGVSAQTQTDLARSGPRHLGVPGAPAAYPAASEAAATNPTASYPPVPYPGASYPPASEAPTPTSDETAPTVVINFGEATADQAAYPSGAAPATDPPTDLLPASEGPTGGAPYGAPPSGVAAAALTSSPPELVTCPECGATQQVQLNRRAASDFCSQCDFPLFWTPSRVERERAAASNGESLRRLPGTVGRSTLASAACPHCAELNLVSAVVCIRCGQSMHPVAAPPPPPPPPAPLPPPPVIEVVPERGIPWWVWALLGVGIAALITLVVLILTGTVG